MVEKIIDTKYGKSIYIDSDKIADDMYFAEKNNIKNVIISEYFNLYKIKNIDFIKHYPFIENVTISAYNQIDYSALHYLNKLKVLNINLLVPDKGELDFECFPEIIDIGIEWTKKRINIFNAKTLKEIFLLKFKGKDLQGFNQLENLQKLNLMQTSIENLAGISFLSTLKILDLSYNRKLNQINEIEKLDLKELRITNCKMIYDIENIKYLKNLTHLKIDNCGDIKSLSPIKYLNKLKEVTLWDNTNVLDGDLEPLKRIENFSFINRKHYNYTFEELTINKNFR